MFSPLKLVIFGLFSASSMFAQPTIGGIVNSASYVKAPTDSNNNPVGNNLIAQGAIFDIFGSNLGPATLVQSSGLPLTTSIPDSNGTSVSITSGGQTVNAYMVYALSGQVAAILPSNTPIGAATMTVTYNGQTSKPAPFNVVASGLGIFTTNQQGDGQAIVQVYHGSNASVLGALTQSAQPGDTLVVYGTGLGAIAGADNTAPGAVPVGSNVVVNIAGQAVTPLYAGRAPQFPGLDQINFQLPANVPSGCYIPAEITASGQPSNQFVLPIASGTTTCTHPFGLNASALATLDAGGTVNAGLFLLLQAKELGVTAAGVGGLFDNANANAVFQMYNRIQVAFGGTNFPVATGSCAVMDTTVPYIAPSVPDFSLIGGNELDAGGAVQIAGPGNYSNAALHLTNGGYETVFLMSLPAGAWTVSGTGGSAVGAFSATTTLPSALVWTNAGNLGSPPRQDLTIAWSGGNGDSASLVTIFGSEVVINPTDPSKNRGAQFFCNAPAGDGKFVVPASVTSRLPSSDVAAGEVAFGALGINTGGGASFTAPLTTGKLDAGFFAFGEAQSQIAMFK